jgi:hypothetical protein
VGTGRGEGRIPDGAASPPSPPPPLTPRRLAYQTRGGPVATALTRLNGPAVSPNKREAAALPPSCPTTPQ